MVEVELTSKDYEKIQNWYSLAFAKMAVDKISKADLKLCVVLTKKHYQWSIIILCHK